MTGEVRDMNHLSPTLQSVTKRKRDLVDFIRIFRRSCNLHAFGMCSSCRKWICIQNRHSHGVTLIELLVSLLIMGIIIVSVHTAFDCGKQSWQVGEALVQRYQNARGALDMMAREISAMCLTISSIYETGLIYDGTSGNKSFRFAASIYGNDGDWDLCKIAYRYDGGNEIERSFLTDFTKLTLPPSSWQPLVLNLYRENPSDPDPLEFRWWNSSSSQFEAGPWNSTIIGGSNEGQIPEAIEISITVRDDKKYADPRTFKTIVYIPRSEQ